MSKNIKEALISKAKELGISAIGFTSWPLPTEAANILAEEKPCPFTAANLEARLSGNTKLATPKSIIVCLFSYYADPHLATDLIIPPINLSRYTWSKDYHLVVPNYLDKLGNYLQELSPDTSYEIHCDTSPLADRYVAYLSGLGFYGKNHCLIHPQLGSYLVIGSLLIDLKLPTDTPLKQSCLGCNRCIKTCPGQALGKERFQFETCKSYLTQKKDPLTTEEKQIIGKTPLIFGCDICQEVCPHNKDIPLTGIPEFQTVEPYVNSQNFTNLTNKEFKKIYGHRAFSWRGKKILLRNHELTTKEST